MSKSAGIHFHSAPSSPGDAIQTQKSAPERMDVRTSAAPEFQSVIHLLAQKIQARAGHFPHTEEFIRSQKAALEEEIVSRLIAPRRARKF